MARFELAGDTLDGWLETRDGSIAFWTRRGTDAAVERVRSRFEGEDPARPQPEDVRELYRSFQRQCFAAGWRRVPHPPREVIHIEPRDQALEAALLASDADLDAWLIYADWFQERCHARGHAIAFQVRAETDPAFAVRAEAAQRELIAPLVPGPGLSLSWHRGFLDGVRLTTAPPISANEDKLWEVLRHPSARLLRRLDVHGWTDGKLFADVLLATHAPPLRELVLGVRRVPPARLENFVGRRRAWPLREATAAWRVPAPPIGDLGRLGERYPRLVDVELNCDSSGLAGLRLPNARRLAVLASNLRGAALAAVLDAVGPELETLELQFGPHSECTAADLAHLCDGRLQLPRLRTLRLIDMGFADDVCAMLAASPVLRQLDTLDLSMGRLTDRGVAELRAVRGDLHLEAYGTSAASQADTAAPQR